MTGTLSQNTNLTYNQATYIQVTIYSKTQQSEGFPEPSKILRRKLKSKFLKFL